jgi:hypothetical protein
MALSTTPDWQWLSVREDNPWYPTMRILRQKKFMEWAPVLDRLAAELRKVVPSSMPTRSVVIEAAPGELIDKITILEIKAERIRDEDKASGWRQPLSGREDRGLTPPARHTRRSEVIVSSKVDMDKKVTPRTWLAAELKNRGHSERILRILQEE